MADPYSRRDALNDLEMALVQATKQRVTSQQALIKALGDLREAFPDPGEYRVARRTSALGWAVDDALAEHMRWHRDTLALAAALQALAAMAEVARR